MEFKRIRKGQRAGFTLVEMLIVLGILVLLFAMVVPRFIGSQKKAKVDLAKIQIGNFRAALERYYIDCDQFPSSEQGLQALVSQPADLPDNVTWRGPYVSGDIAADPWGNPYQYENPPTHGSGDTPDIWSFGPNGEEGDDDDICSWTGASQASGEEAATADMKLPKTQPPVRSADVTPKSGTKASPLTTPKAASPRPRRTAPEPQPIRSEIP